ncbi:MAG: hypothetical protein A3K19_25875 [Lentisphaerae bacterium RIFOXYB12_FULL_65_16]|nr:MAG: hypothetical protein A3K18_31875 [Lentisphaerae bacterium RIFOXYA12_64_32]OGV91400.1 MAG: hypothetical protein A3K19_25875 [Lentisphaerae bacterium RIFOXYB12_FULL_65_16]
MRGCVVSAVMLSGCAGLQGQGRRGLALTENGSPKATIVLAKDASCAARFAAAELQEHVKKITGATLPMVADDQPAVGTTILVGESAATRALGLKSGDFKPQEHLVRFLPNTIVLMGRDADAAQGAGVSVPPSVAGKFGNGRRFDGKTTVICLPGDLFDDAVGSLEAWVWIPAQPQPTHGTILRLDGANPWTYHIIQRDANSNRLSYTTYDGGQGHGLGSVDLAEGWHHVLGTYEAAAKKMELFVDGRSVGTTVYVRTTCKGAVLGVGGIADSAGKLPGNAFTGIIDEVRISKCVRSPLPEGGTAPYAVDAATTHLFHFDEDTGGPVDSAGGATLTSLPGLFEDRGTLDAVYDFLERRCDVRWYAPTDLGVVCPQTPTLAVRGRDIRRAPAMQHRWIAGSALFMPGPPDKVPGRDRQIWMLRMRLGGKSLTVGHSFYGYYDRFLKEHPDWFAQGYGTGKPPQMCYTNPGFIAQTVQDARDYFDGKGGKAGASNADAMFGLVPMDNSEWCKCERCQAELNAAEKANQQFNNGIASDYIYNFSNKVACELRKTHPDKWLGQLAYSTYAYHPDKVKLDPNISVQLCLHTRNWWCPSMEVNDRKVLADWRRGEPDRPLYLWLYYCFPALNAQYGHFHYFPGFFAHAVVEQMKMYHDARVTGIFLENSSECNESYLMDQLEFYVTFKLADDPSLDGNALIDEFFTRYYGAAAGPMKELYCRIEDTFSNPKYYPPEIQNSAAHQHQTEELAWGSLGTDLRMADLASLMDQAKAAASSDIEKQRVAVFEKGIWNYMVEGRAKYLESKKLRAQPPPQVSVPRLTAPADGDPAKVDWDRAALLSGWGGLSGGAAKRQIEGRIAWDGRFVYLQFSDSVDPARLVSNADVWGSDDWELFFALQRSKPYRQLAVAPNGKTASLSWTQEGSGTWDSGVAAVSDTSGKDRWTVRLALPVEKFLPGEIKGGSKVYANFYRGAPEAGGYLAWTPPFANGFHDLTRLAELTLE